MDTLAYEQLRPPAALFDAIECFWRLLLPIVVAPDEIISAEHRAEILFQFEGQSQILPHTSELPFACASSWLMRPFAHALHVRQVGVSSSAMIGVRFRPGGWAAFRHTDTTDRQAYSFMPLRDFYPPSDVRQLEQQLYQTLRTPHWADPLIGFFLGRRVQLAHGDQIVYATQQLQQRQISIAALADEVNLSERQFGRVFRQQVGLSPKQFARIARLNRVLHASASDIGGLTLEQVARRCGYHDPSHLVHEFQSLVGVSPLAYFTGSYDLIDQKFRKHDRFLQ
ncbi:helix-turn-helix transcriptional regulator [Chloroflexia bacterium SDU3-3]|nr:helix-turn-helix transcriptional regulator [Chloroflexia bacterium SDU3-3]